MIIEFAIGYTYSQAEDLFLFPLAEKRSMRFCSRFHANLFYEWAVKAFQLLASAIGPSFDYASGPSNEEAISAKLRFSRCSMVITSRSSGSSLSRSLVTMVKPVKDPGENNLAQIFLTGSRGKM